MQARLRTSVAAAGPPSASPFSGSAVQGSQSTPHGLAGPANMLPLTPPGSDLLMPDLPENSQVCPLPLSCPSITMRALMPPCFHLACYSFLRGAWVGLQAEHLVLQMFG